MPTAPPPTEMQLSLFDDPPPAAVVALALPSIPAPPTGSTPLPATTSASTPPPTTAPTTASTNTSSTASTSAPTPLRHPQAQREIRLGEHLVGYELRRARRRSIGFVVGVDGLSVSAPRWVGVGEVESALREKSSWILRKLHEQRERAHRVAAARVDWRDGSTIPFLGQTVVVVLDPQATGAVLTELAGPAPQGAPRLTLRLGLPPSAAREQIRDTVQSWLQRQARRLFEERCAVYSERLGVRMKRLSLSSASTRWGSASADGSIRLNWRLVHFRMPVIDYVVAHELAHLREMNHSAAFWDVVRQALPDFESARGALRHEVLPAFD